MQISTSSANPSADIILLKGSELSLPQIVAVARFGCSIDLCPEALKKVSRARQCIEKRLATGEVIYGINTGFGALSDVHIEPHKLEQLQLNLIRSHACGVGAPLESDDVRAVLVLRIQTMLRGNSGVRVETIELMKQFVNRNIVPIVPSKGSVGACGDLAPLAHLAMALIGEGLVRYKGEVVPSREALKAENLIPLSPGAKEGLCLINGTQVMTAIGLLACYDSLTLLQTADVAVAMTLDATLGTATAFRSEIQDVRPHPGQARVSENVLALLKDDGLRLSHLHCEKVQDPYSIRCAPQVHGAARNAFVHVLSTLLCEANSSTDNPLVFPESDEILSGGNFHGEPVAMVLDYLCFAMSALANISERRIEKLVNPHMSGLPAFLAYDSGLNSGYMIPHVVAAALVSENKVYSHPASVDSIPTSAEKEDHVSMGMTSALKLQTVLKNIFYVLTIEWVAAAEGLEFKKPLEGGVGVRAAVKWVRQHSSPMIQDRSLSAEFEVIAAEMKKRTHLDAVNVSLFPGCLT